MKSIKKKLIAAILVCSLFTAVLIGVLAISNSMNTAGKDAVTKLQLTEQKKAQEINSVIQKIQQSVDTLSEVVMSSFDYDAFVKDKAYADTYTKSVQKSVLDFANHTNGAVMFHQDVEEGSKLTELDKSLSGADKFLTENDQKGKTLEYSYKGVSKQLLYSDLDNGMKLILTAPKSEIYGEAYGLAKLIIGAMLVAFILSAVIGVILGIGITKPIRQLTDVIDQTARLDFCPTENGEKLRKHKDEIGVMAGKIHDMRKKLHGLMEELQQTQQTLEVSTGDLNELMKQNSAIAEDNSAVTQELAAGMQETRANTASIVESVRIMEQSSGNIHRLAADGAENSSQIQERAGEMERISTQSRNKTDEIFLVVLWSTMFANRLCPIWSFVIFKYAFWFW